MTDRATSIRTHGTAPRWRFGVMNPLMEALLRSPFHERVSRQLMLLSFTDPNSGKTYSAPVSVRIQGKEMRDTDRPLCDPVEIHSLVQTLAAANGEERARQMGFWVEDLARAAPQLIRRATMGTEFVKIILGIKR